MMDLILEIIRASICGIIVIFLLFNPKFKQLLHIEGWRYFQTGFVVLFISMIIDITDNFESLNQFIIIGNTKYQAIIEKIFGYPIGILKWIPNLIEIHNRKKEELEKARTEVKTLSGFLPICASCKKIRDDKGYWNQIESYISTHSEADFSHGMCPEGLEKFYPDIHDPKES